MINDCTKADVAMKRTTMIVMVAGISLGAFAGDASEHVRKAVESRFPGAVIQEIEQEV